MRTGEREEWSVGAHHPPSPRRVGERVERRRASDRSGDAPARCFAMSMLELAWVWWIFASRIRGSLRGGCA